MQKLKNLYILLNKNKEFYTNYNKNNSFLNAKKIRKINNEIYDLIKNDPKSKFPLKLQNLILELKIHIEEWGIAWKKEEKIKQPEDHEYFRFNGYLKFPVKIISKIEECLKE